MTPYYRVYDNQEHATHGGKFDSLEGAESKALELAAKYPGSSFEILRCVGIAQTSKASTFWMDGEQPPEKPRYMEMREGDVFREGDEYKFFGEWFNVPDYSFGFALKDNYLKHPHRRPL